MTPEQFEAATGRPLEEFSHDCHAASVALVRSGVYEECRVARGFCPGVGGQHSWVVLGMDCYDPMVVVIDPTFWSYQGWEPGVRKIEARAGGYSPHGAGSIWEWGRPNVASGPVLELDTAGMSPAALDFLDLLGPLDVDGWRMLAHAPVEEWPSGEIFAAMSRHPQMAAWIPIDILGMTTTFNPGGLYLPVEEVAA